MVAFKRNNIFKTFIQRKENLAFFQDERPSFLVNRDGSEYYAISDPPSCLYFRATLSLMSLSSLSGRRSILLTYP